MGGPSFADAVRVAQGKEKPDREKEIQRSVATGIPVGEATKQEMWTGKNPLNLPQGVSSGISDVPKSVLDEDVKLINELLQKLGHSVVTLQTIRDDILLGVDKYRKEYIAALEDLWAERQFQQKSPAATAQKAVDVLNSAFEADPRALWAIWNNRVPANEGLQDHPRVVVDAVPALGSSEYFLSLEGLLYGMFTAMGLPTITIDWEIYTKRVNRFKGFKIRKEPVRVKNDGATADG